MLKKITVASCLIAQMAFACPDDTRLLLVSCDSAFTVQLKSLTAGDLAPDAQVGELVVTGAYSSADRFGVEGLAIESGALVSRRFQSWDGLAVISADGAVTLHHVEQVLVENTVYNLRKPEELQKFVELAAMLKLSVIQSHLLVTDGVIDVRDRENQPRFRRRVLFVTAAGDVGIFDSGREALTLFDTATELHGIGASMAFNLDMGAYDYCSKNGKRCGLLRRENTRILTNVLRFSPSH